MLLSFVLNGEQVSIETRFDKRALDLLREDFGLTGVKEACGSGECGACSVLVDDKQKLSCLMLAGQLQNKKVTTIEGLGTSEKTHILQKKFIEKGAVQCGYCTPGMIISSYAFLNEISHVPERQEIRKAISGNICRCTGYQKIVDAIEQAAKNLYGKEEL